jgi:hypothetical protein
MSYVIKYSKKKTLKNLSSLVLEGLDNSDLVKVHTRPKIKQILKTKNNLNKKLRRTLQMVLRARVLVMQKQKVILELRQHRIRIILLQPCSHRLVKEV